jgi:hypothetical protein
VNDGSVHGSTRPNPDTRHSEMPSIKLSSDGYFTKNAGKLAPGRLSHKGKTRLRVRQAQCGSSELGIKPANCQPSFRAIGRMDIFLFEGFPGNGMTNMGVTAADILVAENVALTEASCA